MKSPIERLTAAAIKCFRSSGIEGTTMDDVAKLARISRPNIYRYVSNRDDLVRLVVLDSARNIKKHIRVKTGDWEDVLVDLFVQQVSLAVHDEIFMIIVEQAAPVAARLLVDDQAVGGALNEILLPVIADVRQSGRVRDDITDEETLHWLHYQVWCLAREPRLVETMDLENLARRFIIGGLVALHRPRPR